ncbi:MAG: HEPN domain-containing protein [Victivallaceae bacterium]|nr:HEPN domain-containing protein [Victivallaceae bacterium]
MKQTIEHLPEIKRLELNDIVSVIRGRCGDVEMIILFGSYARGNYKVEADLKPDRRSGHASDYDILVVPEHKTTVDDSLLWRKITEECNALKTSAHPRIIVHDIWDLNIKLVKGQYFFSDIKKEGRMLFDSGRFELAGEQKQTQEEKRRIAQEHFDYWFERANQFFKTALDHVNKEWYSLAAFDLQQSAEHSFKAILLVFTNYLPNEHRLGLLSLMAAKEDNSLAGIFPCETQEEEDRFRLLDEAYIGGRYDPKYRISKEDLEILAVHVKKLLDRTEKVCQQKIKSFTK